MENYAAAVLRILLSPAVRNHKDELGGGKRQQRPPVSAPSCGLVSSATGDSSDVEFRGKDLLPAYLADADLNRALLDRRVICEAVRHISAK